jgi:hypothetical protein
MASRGTAARHRSTVVKIAARHKAKTETSDGPRTCFEAKRQREGNKDLKARFDGMPFKHDRLADLGQTHTGPARLGSPHGAKAAQDSHRLRDPPRAHPRQPVTHAA